MDYISENDIYEIRIASLISNVDKDVIVELYQPLIGFTATILYLTLLKQKRNEDDETIVFTHNDLMALMNIKPGILLEARSALEGVGLLKTYQKRNKENNYLIYVIFAPKTPKEFFDDVLFKGLLVQAIGEKEAKRLAAHYYVDGKIPSGFNDISASFIDIFNPNYDDDAFKTNFGKGIVGHEVGRIVINFSYDLFFRYIENNSQISSDAFTKKDMHEIERLATFYSLSEETMASIVISSYDPNKKQHINFESVNQLAKDKIKYPLLQEKRRNKSNINSDSLIAQKIKMMEEKSPVSFLAILQGNTKPANSDVMIANSLSKDYGFPNGIVNTIIEYVLTKNNNVLSKNYCEKVASSLARENVETTVDAMNYLNKLVLSSKNKTIKSEQKNTKINNEENKNSNEVSDNELDDLLKDLDALKK